MDLPKDVKNQFVHGVDKPKQLRGKPMSKFKASLQTENLAEAEMRKRPFIDKWKYMIQMARLKNKGHVIDLNETAEAYNK